MNVYGVGGKIKHNWRGICCSFSTALVKNLITSFQANGIEYPQQWMEGKFNKALAVSGHLFIRIYIYSLYI